VSRVQLIKGLCCKPGHARLVGPSNIRWG
jgi:hypothetical protein